MPKLYLKYLNVGSILQLMKSMLSIQTVLYFLLFNTILATAAGKTFTMADIKSQKLTVFSGNVYDLSKYAKDHPGGADKIQKVMGVDGTDALKKNHGLEFANKVKGSMVGTLAATPAPGAENAAPSPAQSGAAAKGKDGKAAGGNKQVKSTSMASSAGPPSAGTHHSSTTASKKNVPPSPVPSAAKGGKKMSSAASLSSAAQPISSASAAKTATVKDAAPSHAPSAAKTSIVKDAAPSHAPSAVGGKGKEKKKLIVKNMKL
jgi:hypothetical protein